ncbi:MAG TPA: class I SAM-dependent methyltransferase, partial [Actinomycetes bacterium]
MGGELDWAAGVEHLRLADAFSVALYREIAAWLAPGRESRVLDAGCGAGGMTVQLAQAVGPAGQVVAMDGEPAAVAATSSLVAEHGLADRVEVVVGELPAAAARAGPFDLIWASRVVHHLADEAAGVRALAASLRPAGRLALAEGGLPMGCLSFDTGVGEPGLEDRLAAAATRWFTALRGGLPAATARHHGWTTVVATPAWSGLGLGRSCWKWALRSTLTRRPTFAATCGICSSAWTVRLRKATAGRWPGSPIPATRPTSVG